LQKNGRELHHFQCIPKKKESPVMVTCVALQRQAPGARAFNV